MLGSGGSATYGGMGFILSNTEIGYLQYRPSTLPPLQYSVRVISFPGLSAIPDAC